MSAHVPREADFQAILESSLSLESRLDSLRDAIISNEGLNEQYVLALESISPGCIVDSKPRGMVIMSPTPDNLTYAVESIDRIKMVIAGGVIAAILLMITKFFTNFGSGSSNGGGSGGGGSGNYNVKDPTVSFDNLVEQNQGIQNQIQTNVDALKDVISREVMLTANIKSDSVNLLKKAGKTDKEIEHLTKSEHDISKYLLNAALFTSDIRWHNGGQRLPMFLTSHTWKTTIQQIKHALEAVIDSFDARRKFSLECATSVMQLWESMDGFVGDLYDRTAIHQQHSASQKPDFHAYITKWMSDLTHFALIKKEPVNDLNAILTLSRQQPIEGFAIDVENGKDSARGEVTSYFSQRISSLRFHDNANKQRMPNINDFQERLGEFSHLAFTANVFISQAAEYFQRQRGTYEESLLRIKGELANRNEVPTEVRFVIVEGIKYAEAQYKLTGNFLAAVMNLRSIYEFSEKAYSDGHAALVIANKDLDNLLKRMTAAAADIEKKKAENHVHRH